MADESSIYAAIVAAAGIQAVLGNPARFYDQRVPESVASPATAPYVVARVVADTPENQLDGGPGVDLVRIQFDIYAETKASAKGVLAPLRVVLEPLGYEMVTLDFADPTTDLRNIKSDWEFWLPR